MVSRVIATFLFLLLPLISFAEDDQNLSKIESFNLANGLKIVLMQTKNEANEVLVSLTAAGGFAELPKNHRAAGEISAEAALRSGISDFGLDKMQTMLYDYSIEVYPNMQPFFRSVEFTACSEELDHLFQFINLFFTKSRFSIKAFNPYKKARIERIRHLSKDYNRVFNEALMNFNTNQFHPFQPLREEEVENASFQISREFFQRSFTNPADFVCVIVGDFDKAQARSLIEKCLASIPNNEAVISPKIPSLPDFPKGVRTHTLRNRFNQQAMSRLTFPIQLSISRENVSYLNLLAGIIRERLTGKFSETSFEKPEIIVSLEFPYYPSFHSAWISVQYTTESKYVTSLGQSLLAELKKISENGFSQQEWSDFLENTKACRRLSILDNCFWLTHIVNYSLWGWDLTELDEARMDFDKFSLATLNKIAGQAISFEQYSRVSMQP